MTAKKPSQTALYGEILTAEQQYRRDLFEVTSPLSREQEQALLQEVKAGNSEAKNQLLSFLFSSVLRFATWYRGWLRAHGCAVHHCEVLDLAEIGNLAILERFDQVIQEKDHPVAYLIVCARNAIEETCRREETLISTPISARPDEKYRVESLDVPIVDGEQEILLADVLAAPLPLMSDESAQSENKPVFEAVKRLPAKRQDLLIRVFGLFDSPCSTLEEIACEDQLIARGLWTTKNGALVQLHHLLRSAYPQFCQDVVFIPNEKKWKRNPGSHLTPVQQERLEQAYACLLSRKEKITVRAMQLEAHIDTDRVRTFLYQHQWQSREPERGQRLSQAYQRMQASGQKIRAQELAKAAQTSFHYARSYLQQVQFVSLA